MHCVRPIRTTTAYIVLAFVSAVIHLGCADVLGFDDITFDQVPSIYMGPSSSWECGTVPTVSLSCAQCIDDACCTVAQACGENRDCTLLARCRMNCDDHDIACLHDCGIDHFPGMDAWRDLHDCEAQSCLESCVSE